MTSPLPPQHTLSHFLTAAVCAAAGIGLLLFAWFQVWQARKDALAATEAIISYGGKEKEVRYLATQAHATKEARSSLKGLAVPEGGSVLFIGAIEALGKTANVSLSIDSVSSQPPQGVTPGRLSLSVRFSGTFAACTQFMRLLETTSAGLIVSSLSLQYDDSARLWSGMTALSVVSFDTL